MNEKIRIRKVFVVGNFFSIGSVFKVIGSPSKEDVVRSPRVSDISYIFSASLREEFSDGCAFQQVFVDSQFDCFPKKMQDCFFVSRFQQFGCTFAIKSSSVSFFFKRLDFFLKNKVFLNKVFLNNN